MIVDRLEALTFTTQPRKYIGVSQIGNPCERQLWRDRFQPIVEEYGYRKHDILERGHLEEPRIFAHLKKIDIELTQTQVKAEYLSLKGHADAIITDGRSGKKYILEIKTMKQESFKELEKNGAKETHFTYWTQCQCYMGLLGIRQALLLVRNKNTEKLYEEIIEFDDVFFTHQLDKASRIASAKTMPLGFSLLKKNITPATGVSTEEIVGKEKNNEEMDG